MARLNNQCYHKTVESAAACAAPIFARNRWKWSGVGVPSKEELIAAFRAIAAPGYRYAESERLGWSSLRGFYHQKDYSEGQRRPRAR